MELMASMILFTYLATYSSKVSVIVVMKFFKVSTMVYASHSGGHYPTQLRVARELSYALCTSCASGTSTIGFLSLLD